MVFLRKKTTRFTIGKTLFLWHYDSCLQNECARLGEEGMGTVKSRLVLAVAVEWNWVFHMDLVSWFHFHSASIGFVFSCLLWNHSTVAVISLAQWVIGGGFILTPAFLSFLPESNVAILLLGFIAIMCVSMKYAETSALAYVNRRQHTSSHTSDGICRLCPFSEGWGSEAAFIQPPAAAEENPEK